MRNIKVLLSILAVSISSTALAHTDLAASEQKDIRVEHARELLGNTYGHSIVRKGEKVATINKQIFAWTKSHMPKAQRGQYKAVAQAIIDEGMRREFDPAFLLSVIQGESSFNPRMKGSLDEIGLMQVRPGTAKWIAEKYHIKYKRPSDLYNPITNIRIGAAYLALLREKFDSHAQLYIAAYNMGARNVAEAREEGVWPKDYPTHVMKVYVEFYSDLTAPKRSIAKI